MKTRPSVFGAVAVLMLVAIFFLGGCDVLEGLIEGDSRSGQQAYDQPQPTQPQPTKRQPVLVEYNATLEITQFTCHDGEEDDYTTSSGEDEITFVYTILETDRTGWAVRSSSHGWGPYDVHAGESYGSQYFKNLTLSQVPLGHGLVVTLSIVEIEDYSEAQGVMDTINKYAFYVDLANTFNPEPYSKTAIEIAGDILYYAGKALDIVDWADDDDLLADHVDVGDPSLVHSTLLGGGQLYNDWTFYGENESIPFYPDYFEYEVSYVVHLQPIYR